MTPLLDNEQIPGLDFLVEEDLPYTPLSIAGYYDGCMVMANDLSGTSPYIYFIVYSPLERNLYEFDVTKGVCTRSNPTVVTPTVFGTVAAQGVDFPLISHAFDPSRNRIWINVHDGSSTIYFGYYDLTLWTWVACTAPPGGVSTYNSLCHTCSNYHGGNNDDYIYIIGTWYKYTYRYSVSNNNWTNLNPNPNMYDATYSWSKFIQVPGWDRTKLIRAVRGSVNITPDFATDNTISVYDIVNNSWSLLPTTGPISAAMLYANVAPHGNSGTKYFVLYTCDRSEAQFKRGYYYYDLSTYQYQYLGPAKLGAKSVTRHSQFCYVKNQGREYLYTSGVDYVPISGTPYERVNKVVRVDITGMIPSDVVYQFPSCWPYHHTITVDHTKVLENCTNFPLLLADQNLRDEVYTNAKSDGSDIRFTSDLAGTQPIPFEIVSFNPGAKTCEIWVKVPTLSSLADTSIYIWYGNPLASWPRTQDAWWYQRVWSDYAGVWHMDNKLNDVTTVGSVISDSSLLVNHATKYAANNPPQITGKIGKAQDFNGSDSYITVDSSAYYQTKIDPTTLMTIQAWTKRDTVGTPQFILRYYAGSSQGFGLHWDASNLARFLWGSYYTDDTVINDSNYHFVYGIKLATELYVGVDDVVPTYYSGLTFSTLTSTLALTFGGYSNYHDGPIDEIRICYLARSVNWMNTEYANQNAPSTFVSHD